MGTNVRSTKSLVMADALCQTFCGRAGAQTCLQLNLEQSFQKETEMLPGIARAAWKTGKFLENPLDNSVFQVQNNSCVFPLPPLQEKE